jgi:hypothetical protein
MRGARHGSDPGFNHAEMTMRTLEIRTRMVGMDSETIHADWPNLKGDEPAW